MVSHIPLKEIELLAEILERHPLESLKKIAELEGISYGQLRKLYMRHYGREVTVSAIFDIWRLGLDSYVALLNVEKNAREEVLEKLRKNPFVVYLNPIFGYVNGLMAILHVPVEQEEFIPSYLSKLSDRFEVYRIRSYPKRDRKTVEKFPLNRTYAKLMDTLKYDARTPISRLSEIIGKSPPTVKFMINRLIREGIIRKFQVVLHVNVHDRGVIGITREKRAVESILTHFKDYEIVVGVLEKISGEEEGYMVEILVPKGQDVGPLMIEFGPHCDKMIVDHLEPFREINKVKFTERFSRMIDENGKYRSILEF